ncbi:MAG: hypothetical protein OXC95_08870 [Dehalococcoidia bacterium]|nr:hypothetical protein [Dehalococcoidia bacterium]
MSELEIGVRGPDRGLRKETLTVVGTVAAGVAFANPDHQETMVVARTRRSPICGGTVEVAPGERHPRARAVCSALAELLDRDSWRADGRRLWAENVRQESPGSVQFDLTVAVGCGTHPMELTTEDVWRQ